MPCIQEVAHFILYTTISQEVLPLFLRAQKLMHDEVRLLPQVKASLKSWNSKRWESNSCLTPKPTFFSLKKKQLQKIVVLFGLSILL